MIDLDIKVAEALGWADIQDNAYTPAGRMLCGTPPKGVTPMWSSGRSAVPRFSEDIAAAMTLVDVLFERGLEAFGLFADFGSWSAAFAPTSEHLEATDDHDPWEYGETAAAAIVAAFLAAMQRERKETNERS